MKLVDLNDLVSGFGDWAFTVQSLKGTIKRMEEKQQPKKTYDDYDDMDLEERLEEYRKPSKNLMEIWSRHY